jgi:hypothetical protein
MSSERWAIAGLPEMLDLAAGHASARKLDLFNIWCCQVLRPYLRDHRSITASRFAERHVDEPRGENAADREAVKHAAHEAVLELTSWANAAGHPAEYRRRRVYAQAAHVADQTVSATGRNRGVLANSKHTAHVFAWANDDGRDPLIGQEGEDGLTEVHFRKQEAIFREIVGNPFAPVEFDPRWRTSDVIGLAWAIYDERAFARLPILSDALMDAGCEDEAILTHCRTPNIHVRGCWLVDLILGQK